MPNEFTYSFDPSYRDVDMVRSLIGDTDFDSPILMDPEIQAHINATPGKNLYRAAARCARAIAGKYARKVDVAADDIKKSLGQARKAFLDLAADFDLQAAMLGTACYAGGISKGDKDGVEKNPDRSKPFFTRKTGAPVGGDIGILNQSVKIFTGTDD